MAFTGEAAWRWKMLLPSEDRLYETFWRQAMRWLAGGSPDPVALSMPDAAMAGDVVSVSLLVRDADFAPVGGAAVSLTVAGPGGVAQKLMDHVRSVTGATTEVQLVDGSGLSTDDRVAPSVFISYLTRFPMTPAGRNFPLLLPANGEGTLGRLGGMPGQGVVRAKTGTLGNVSTLVGYLGRPEGVLVVTLMYNGGYSYTARQEQWRLFRTLGADAVQIPEDHSLDIEPVQLGGDDEGPALPSPNIGFGIF